MNSCGRPAGRVLAALIASLIVVPFSCAPELGEFAVVVEPRAPLEGEALQATALRDDEAPELAWTWLRDGEGVPDLADASVPEGTTLAGERWAVLVEQIAAGQVERAATAEVRVRAPAPVVDGVDADGDTFEAPEDCDDSDAEVFPGADEVCNGLDDDCDDVLPGEEADGDGDGWAACDPVDPSAFDGGDCEDLDPEINPGADEVCELGTDEDQLDDNCVTGDENDALLLVLLDSDGDGVGSSSVEDSERLVCGDVPEGFAFCGLGPLAECEEDCDDEDETVSPRASEVCDGLDNDCDGCGGEADGALAEDCTTDEAEDEIPGDIDLDGDGVPLCAGDVDDDEPGVGVGTVEVCDGLDNDGDGVLPDEEADDDGDGVLVCAGDCDDG